MGTVQILRPQDCLTERSRFTAAAFHCRSYGNPYTNPRINRKPPQQRRPTSEAASSKRPSSEDISIDVTVIFQGDSLLDPKQPRRHLQVEEDQARRKCDIYAGMAFSVSPEPSSLPLPSFSKKKDVTFDDSATRDLRRLLRLD